MPSIEQCDAATGSVAALPSTLEIFDKFKPATGNGKDSDSEESFHLVLDDDEVENQSVVSNGRDKDIINEESEDDILNKFETLPSTPDHMDSLSEDIILNEAEDYSDSNKENVSNADPTNQVSNEHSNNSKWSNTEVKITYAFDGYEDSGDGEFKSIYETDDANPDEESPLEEEIEKHPDEESPLEEEIEKHPDEESPLEEEIETPNETDEPMEVIEERPNTVEDTNTDKLDEDKAVETPLADNFEDSMDVEQEDTNPVIANIIETLEDRDQDAPMVEPDAVDNAKEAIITDLDDSDVNMAEISEAPATNEQILQTNHETIDDDDVEMADEDAAVGHDSQEHEKENVEQIGSGAIKDTFQEPAEEASDSAEAFAGEAEVQAPLSPEGVCATINEDNNENIEESATIAEEPATIAEESATIAEESATIEEESTTIAEESATIIAEESATIAEESENKEQKEDTTESGDDILEQAVMPRIDMLEAQDSAVPDVEEKNDSTDVCAQDNLASGENDLLSELDETIKEPADPDQTPQTNIETEIEKPSSIEEEAIFKVPEIVPKAPEEEPSSKEDKEGPDISNEKSNDKIDDDEGDLLDISMVRETDEDDACAIADAIEDSTAMEDTDKEAHVSEKSDEEQSERVETEQEGSDVDKDQESNDDNDNAMGFDDLDDDSRLEGDDSSNTDSSAIAKNKIIEICESSKESTSDSDSKQTNNVEDSSSAAQTEDKIEDTSMIFDVDDDTSEPAKIDEPQSSTDKETDSSAAQDKVETTDTSKTDKEIDKAKEASEVPIEVIDDVPQELICEENIERKKSNQNKRSYSLSETDQGAELLAKKARLAVGTENQNEAPEKQIDPIPKPPEKSSPEELPWDKINTLTSFANFMKCRKLNGKLSRSDLEQFCIQKICESLMLKSSEGEMHQTIKKHEKTIDNLRKDLQQLTKQCKDLEIVNKKLMNELKNQNAVKKPLVPLKITRSVGLQVRLNPGNEVASQNRRRQSGSSTPQKQISAVNPGSANMNRVKTPNPGNVPSTVVRQVLQSSPQKSPLTTGQTTTNAPMLSQALQKRPVVAKRTTPPVRKSVELPKPGHPGVIDLTDEDDRLAQAKSASVGSTIKIIKAISQPGTPNKAMAVNKAATGAKNMNKPVGGASKTVTVGSNNKANNLSQGIRLTSASVITSSANGSPQMVYVVPTITSNSGGQQKVAFVNFQPTNGVLSGTLNGSTVSVMANKPGQTLTLKTMPSPMRSKHPAALPTPPRISLDPKLKPLLPKPLLTIKKIDTGIILQWKMPYNLDSYESIASYQLYAYQETSSPPSPEMWRKVGDVKALALPMACTLTQFADKNKYYFAVRSVDVHKRIGAFSDPEEISL